MLVLCCLRIANVQYMCTHVRRTCVTTQWVAGENPRRADFSFFLLPSFLVNAAMLFLYCLRIVNVQYNCTHVCRSCVTTQWVAGENPRRADFCFFLLPSSLVNGAMLFLCCLRIANVQYKCTHVRRTCVTTQWVAGENPRRADFFSFCQAPWSMGQCCFCVVCALPMYNTSARTYVGLVSRPSGWSEKIRVARIFFYLLPSYLVNEAMLFLCCLRIANVQYKCTNVRRTRVTTQWVAGENPRRSDFSIFLLLSSLVNGAMLFLCCLRIANVQYKCTHVRRT